MPEEPQGGENEAVEDVHSEVAPSKWKKAATKAILLNALTKAKGTNKQQQVEVLMLSI
jgi:hypothetical protein